MNRLFIFGLLLLVLLISGSSARCIPSPNCDCKRANIVGCKGAGTLRDRACGRELGCNANLANHIYQRNGKGGFCHFGPCKKGCTIQFPNSFCKK